MNTPSPRVQSPHILDIISHSAAQTIRLGQRLGEHLHAGDVVLLFGEFGAGKTHFTKGIAQGLGSNDLVNSPSFVLMNEYRAGAAQRRIPIFHIDLYRIDDDAELAGIGLDDALMGDGVCIIEWAERARDWVPTTYLSVHLTHLSDSKRVIRMEPHGKRYEAAIAALKKAAFA